MSRILEERNRELELALQLSDLRQQCMIRVSEYEIASLQDFLDYSLEEAVKLTQSKFGYVFCIPRKIKNSW